MKQYTFILFLLFTISNYYAQLNEYQRPENYSELTEHSLAVTFDLAYKTEFVLPVRYDSISDIKVQIVDQEGQEFDLISGEQYTYNPKDNHIKILETNLLNLGFTLNIFWKEPKPDIKKELELITTKVPIYYMFGSNPLYSDQPFTLITKSENQIVYERKKCVLNCYYENNKLKWTKNLDALGCQVISLQNILEKSGKRINGCDIVIQMENKKIYLINSRNGRMKYFRNQGGDIRF